MHGDSLFGPLDRFRVRIIGLDREEWRIRARLSAMEFREQPFCNLGVSHIIDSQGRHHLNTSV